METEWETPPYRESKLCSLTEWVSVKFQYIRFIWEFVCFSLSNVSLRNASNVIHHRQPLPLPSTISFLIFFFFKFSKCQTANDAWIIMMTNCLNWYRYVLTSIHWGDERREHDMGGLDWIGIHSSYRHRHHLVRNSNVQWLMCRTLQSHNT